MEKSELNRIRVTREMCLSSFEIFIRYFFKARYKRKFIVGDHHKLICQALEKVINGEITRLMINIAPRYGKTEIAVKNFIAYGLAINPGAKFIHLSYSDDLALDNSADARDIVIQDAYQELFPEVQIKHETDSKKKWYTSERGGVYATSSGGQVTGFGAGQVDDEDIDFETGGGAKVFGGAIIIDDPIKPEDADSEIKRTRVNLRYDSTISNRVNSRNTPIIVMMHRLHENDLCGYLLANEPDKWTVLSLPAINENNEALWPFKHTIEELREIENVNPIVFERQYMQNPMPLKGRLYKTFKTYSEIPHDAKKTKAVIDTADTGNDYLCSIVYKPTVTGYYLTDVYYTQKGMEVTEGACARQLTSHNVSECRIESNNGGRGFARNVERICREMHNTKTKITWFHQKDNKQVRIFTKAADVQNMIYYPEDWETRWPEFARHIQSYQAIGKNNHDDAEDALTIVVESETMIKAEIQIIR